MHFDLDFRSGPLVGQTLKVTRRPASITIAFNEGPTTIYVQGKLSKRIGDGFIQQMVEPNYDQITPKIEKGSDDDEGKQD